MTIYNFNEVSGGGTPVDVEVNQLKIGDIIITNKDNVAAYNLEGVDLLKLTEYKQVVNAATYPEIALLSDYQYNANIISTSFISDQNFNTFNGDFNYIRDLDNTFYIFPKTSGSPFYYLNSNNTSVNLGNTNSIMAITELFINFDNFKKILCLYKETVGSTEIKGVIFNKLTNTFSNNFTILSSLSNATSQVIAARLMDDGLIYIVCQTTTGNITILRTSDGVVYENWHTTTMTHYSIGQSNSSDEKGTCNISDNYDFYYTQNNTTELRSLNKINLLTKIKSTNIITYSITNSLSNFMQPNIKNNQILLYKSLVTNTLSFTIFNIQEMNNLDYSYILSNSNQIILIRLIDFNKIFIVKLREELVYLDIETSTQYNYNISGVVYSNISQFYIDYRYNIIRIIYKRTSTGETLRRNINTVKVAETLLIPKQVYSGYQANSYLVTDITEV